MTDPPGGHDSRRATLDIGTQIFARGGNLVLGILVTLILVRSLGESEFGQWVTLLAIVQLVAAFADLGLEPVAVSRAAADPEHEGDWVGAVGVLRVLLAIPATLVAATACVVVSTNDDMLVAGLLLAATLLTSVPNFMRALNQLRVRNDVTMVVLTANSVGWGLAVVVVALSHGSLVAYAAAFLLVNALSAVLQAVLSLRQVRQPLRRSTRLWRTLIAAAASLGAAGAISAAAARTPQIFVFQLQGSADAGLYGAAARLYEQAQFIPMAVMTTLLPIMSVAHTTDPARAKRVLQVSLDYLLLASAPGVVLTIFAGAPILELLFGEEFGAAAPALPVLMGAFVLVALTYPLDNMVIVLGLQRRLIAISTAGLVTMLALNVLLVPPYGFTGGAWSVLGTELVVCGLTFHLVARRLAMRPMDRRAWHILVACGGLAVLLAALYAASSPLWPFLVVTAVGYPALLLATRALSLSELRDLVARRPPTAALGD